MKCAPGKWILTVVGVLCFCSAPPLFAQSSPSPSLEEYVHSGWDQLTRSMDNCETFRDPKLHAQPVLYLPQETPTPPAVASLEKNCGVQVHRLPRTILHFGQLTTAKIPAQGLLYLPNPYVVPGGRFNEMYGWDSYFILLGLLAEHRLPLARGIVENFFFEIEHYGGILNANRTYYFTRSQPPFLSSMIRAVHEEAQAGNPSPEARKKEEAWLRRAYSYAQRDYAFWTSDIHRAGDTGLARYFDIGEGPVPEMEDDSTYYADVIQWLLTHPEVKTNYLVPPDSDSKEADTCDAARSALCAHSSYRGYRLTRDFYRGDRAMRESGFDVSFRFGPFSGSTHHFAAVDLNSLLYQYERDMASFARELHQPREARRWKQRAAARRQAMDRYLWHADKGLYFDYDTTTHQASTYVYASTFYPLWTGAAGCTQAAAVKKHLSDFERAGGVRMSTQVTGSQWDAPYAWAPINWIAAEGLHRAGFDSDARRISTEFTSMLRSDYAREHTLREKYNADTASSVVQISTGYKQNVIGFGWTNGVFLQMQKFLARPESPTALHSFCGGKP